MRSLLLALSLLCGPVLAEEPTVLPFVAEAVDEIAVVNDADSTRATVVFIRGGRVQATRVLCEDMLLVAGDSGFWIVFQDYWVANRAVWAPRLSAYDLADLPPIVEGPWFAANRNMRDLKQPEANR